MTGTTHRPALDLVATDEEAMIREAVGGIARGFGFGYYVGKARKFEPPQELWDALGDGGYLGVNVSERFGGGGLGVRELAIVLEETSAAGCPANMLVVQAVVGSILARHGTDEQQERWLPGLASGKAAFSLAVTEPDAGSNTLNIATVAERDDGQYRLRGQKTYCSGADNADALLIVARTGRDPRGRALLSLFIVPPDAPGLETQHIPTAPLVGERSFQLFLDDVVVDADQLVGIENAGFRALFDGLNPERIMVAASAIGIGRYALAKASRYASERAVWGQPIGAHQGVAHPLAEAKIALELARLMTAKAAALYDARLDAAEAANMAKLAAADAAVACVDQAIQAHGGNGFALEYELTDLYWIARLNRSVPVSREMILNYVAQHALGLPKSY